MKKLLAILLSILLVCTLSACQSTKTWYSTDKDQDQTNVITVTKKDNNHLHVKAECFNGANTGLLEEDFLILEDGLAVYSGRNRLGYSYTVTLSYTEDRMRIKVDYSECGTESDALWFGNYVTISGRYSIEKPEFDNTNIVIEKVFKSDMELAKAVEEFLGGKEYETFIQDFGKSSRIKEEKDYTGRTIIKGELTGLGDWCGFYSTEDGYFYGIYNHRYFSNDPIYQNNPPDYLLSLY